MTSTKKMKKQKIRCAKLLYKGEHPRYIDYETDEEYERINVSNNGPKWVRELLPQNLGPVIIEEMYDDRIVGCLSKEEVYLYTKTKPKDGCVYSKCENLLALWEGSKVSRDDIVDGKVGSRFFEIRNRIWNMKDIEISDLKNLKGGKIVGYYCAKEILGLVEARQRIFCGCYAQQVVKKEGYRRLLKMSEDNGLLIYGYDGFDLDNNKNKMSIRDCIADKDIVFGHELMLVSLLRAEKIWEEAMVPMEL